MSRRLRANLASLALLAALGVVLCLGLAVVYLDLLWSSYGDLTYVHVVDPAHDASGSGRLPDPLDADAAARAQAGALRWAEERHATLLRSHELGYAVCAGSALLERELGVTGLGPDAPPAAYVRNDPALLAAYVRDDVLLPNGAALPVLGTFDAAGAPAFLATADVLCSFSALGDIADAEDGAAVEGVYYTDATDVSGLVAALEVAGYRARVISRPFSAALAELPRNLLATEPLTRLTLYALAALVFCMGYVVLRLVRANEPSVRVRRVFGLTRRRVVGTMALAAVGVLATQATVSAAVLAGPFSFIGERDLARLLLMDLVTSAALLDVVGSAGGAWLLRRTSEGRGHL